ncbi:protein translocase subunit SecF [bacterium]|nr:protein translocase subunit SecF [bacterium]
MLKLNPNYMDFKKGLKPSLLTLAAAFVLLVLSPASLKPSFLPDFIKDSQFSLGLDLQGGSQLDYQIDLRKVEDSDKASVIDGITNIINKRVNKLGVSEPNIYTSKVADEQHIIVELAGVNDLEEAKQRVGKTIQLEFKESNNNISDNQIKEIEEESKQVYAEISTNPENFALISQREQKANPQKVFFQEIDYTFESELTNPELLSTLKGMEANSVYKDLLNNDFGLTFINGRIEPLQGYAALKLIDKKLADKTITEERSIKAKKILITHQESENFANDELSKQDARNLANEIAKNLKDGSTSFNDAVKEHSKDITTNKVAGELKNPISVNSPYPQELIDLAQTIQEPGSIEILETSNGVEVYEFGEIKEKTENIVSENQYKYELLVFSTTPNPWKDTKLNGQYFKRAATAFDQYGKPFVQIEFTPEGGELFAEITERNIQKQVAIFVGGEEISAPVVQQKIVGGTAQITNPNFTQESAQELTTNLNTGAIPAPINLVGQYTIGPNLGKLALDTSLQAALVGLLILIGYMMFLYSKAGFKANIALLSYASLLLFLIKVNLHTLVALIIAFVIYGVLFKKVLDSKEKFFEKFFSILVATFSLFFLTYLLSVSVTLTLAGIAGIVLSIGMAVDANVLIFERIKEEMQNEKNNLKAIEKGFQRAWSSIRDSNYSSLITCGILYYFGTSIIKGFALTLSAGILISMFSAVVITRKLITYKATKTTNDFGSKKIKKFNFNFIQNFNKTSILSGVLILIALVSFATNGLKLGIDFKGGTLIEIQTENEVKEDVIKSYVNEFSEEQNLLKGSVNTSGENSYQIKLDYIDEITHQKFKNGLSQEIEQEITETRFENVGASVSKTLANKAFISLTIALLAIILYIAISFREIPQEYNPFKFGLAAIVALVHDVVITLGIFSLFGIEIDILFITALLTILGFSVHDTIVVFDRIRENLLKIKKSETLEDVSNAALNETLTRSINTSISTLITLLSLFILGAASIKYFILALIIGILVGTYSSIFIAAPTMIKINKK